LSDDFADSSTDSFNSFEEARGAHGKDIADRFTRGRELLVQVKVGDAFFQL